MNEGLTTKQMAEEFGISQRTIQKDIKYILENQERQTIMQSNSKKCYKAITLKVIANFFTYNNYIILDANIAQLVEQRIRNP